MMYGSFVPVAGLLHGIGGLLFLLGLLSLVVWAWRSWKPHDFKKAGMWMLGIGVVLCAISFGATVGMAMDKDGSMIKMKTKFFDCPFDKR